MIRKWLLLAGMIAVMLYLAACDPVNLPEATAIPAQTIWRVSYSPELAWMTDEFTACLESKWNTGLAIEETQDLQPQSSQADVMLVWGDVDPQGLQAFQIGTDQWEAVVNPDLPVKEISTDAFRSIYEGEVKAWSQIDTNVEGEIHGWIYPEHLAIRQSFETDLGGLERISPYMNIAPDVPAMIESISADIHSVGYIPGSWPDPGLRVVTVKDASMAKKPVVALIKLKDDEYLSAWLSCLSGIFPGD